MSSVSWAVTRSPLKVKWLLAYTLVHSVFDMLGDFQGITHGYIPENKAVSINLIKISLCKISLNTIRWLHTAGWTEAIYYVPQIMRTRLKELKETAATFVDFYVDGFASSHDSWNQSERKRKKCEIIFLGCPQYIWRIR
jgi:hypothetical protein